MRDNDATLRNASLRMLLEAVELGVGEGKLTLGEAATGIDWDLVNADARKWADTYSYDLVSQVNDTTRQVLQEKVSQWIDSGEALDALKEALSPWFGEDRAANIAQTETTRSFAEGNRTAWQASDVVTGVTFMTASDELVCDVCGPLDGETFDLDDDEHTPPIHPRCRCWLAPAVD